LQKQAKSPIKDRPSTASAGGKSLASASRLSQMGSPSKTTSNFTQYPDKYGAKYSNTPVPGKYDVEKADK